MKKIALLSSVFLMVSVPFLRAETLDEVLKNHFEAIGQDKLVKVNSIRTTGKIVQMGMEIPFVQMQQRPDNLRVEGTFQGLTFVQTYNGKEGWSLNPFAGATDPQPFSDEEFKSVKYSADMDGMLWNWKDKGYKASLEGQEDMEGTPCFKIQVETNEGDVFTFYIDSDSYMILKTHAKVKVQGNEAETDTYSSNFMMVDGMAFPGKVETKLNGQVVMTMVTDKVEINPELDAALFGKPGKS
jgi:hypothetical protein